VIGVFVRDYYHSIARLRSVALDLRGDRRPQSKIFTEESADSLRSFDDNDGSNKTVQGVDRAAMMASTKSMSSIGKF
jgi:hypothetical protein